MNVEPKLCKCLLCYRAYIIPTEFIEKGFYFIEKYFCKECLDKNNRILKQTRQRYKEEINRMTNAIRIIESYQEYFKVEDIDKKASELLSILREL